MVFGAKTQKTPSWLMATIEVLGIADNYLQGGRELGYTGRHPSIRTSY